MRSASVKRSAPYGIDHELLRIDGVVGVRAAIQDVHHRHGQQARLNAAEIPIERRRCEIAAARAAAMETARIAFAPRRPLFGVPSSSIILRSIAPCSLASMPCKSGPSSDVMCSAALRVPFRGSGICRHRAVRRLRARQWMRRKEPPRGPCCRRRGKHRPRRSGCRVSRVSLCQLPLRFPLDCPLSGLSEIPVSHSAHTGLSCGEAQL